MQKTVLELVNPPLSNLHVNWGENILNITWKYFLSKVKAFSVKQHKPFEKVEVAVFLPLPRPQIWTKTETMQPSKAVHAPVRGAPNSGKALKHSAN